MIIVGSFLAILCLFDELVHPSADFTDPCQFFLHMLDQVLGFMFEVEVFEVAAWLVTIE